MNKIVERAIKWFRPILYVYIYTEVNMQAQGRKIANWSKIITGGQRKYLGFMKNLFRLKRFTPFGFTFYKR